MHAQYNIEKANDIADYIHGMKYASTISFDS